MRVSRKPRLQAGFVVALTVASAAASLVFNADPGLGQTTVVVGGRASAYAIAVDADPLLTVPPTPDPANIEVVTAECPDEEQAGVDVTDATGLEIGLVSARAECNTLGTPLSFFGAEADVATVRIDSVVPAAPDLLAINGVHTECRADANGVTANVTVASITSGLTDIPVGELDSETEVVLPLGLGTLTLREEVSQTANSIIVNGIHVELGGIPAVPPLPGLPAIDIVIGHVECSRVLGQVTTTTTSTTLPGATTTLPGATTTTTSTLPGATTTTTRAGATTTSTTVAGATTTTAAVGGTTTPAVITRPPTVLARTGAELRRALVWAAVAMVLGTLMVMGDRGLSQPATGAASFGPTSFPAANRRRRRPRSASPETFDDAAIDALREMDTD